VKKEAAFHRVKEERKFLRRTKRRKANSTGQILRRNCRIKHVIEGKITVLGRAERRRKQLQDDFKETRRSWKLKEKALDCSMSRTLFGRGYGPVVRQTAW
jgi:hypothetical protein